MKRTEEIIRASELEFGCSRDMEACKSRNAFIDGAEWADAHPHWISVEEQLPIEDKDVLVADDEGNVYVALFIDFCDFKGFFMNDNERTKVNGVTHWMPRPALPKGGKK